MCERLEDESREDMLGRLYARAQMRNDLLQLRAQQAESRAQKAEAIVDKAIRALRQAAPELVEDLT